MKATQELFEVLTEGSLEFSIVSSISTPIFMLEATHPQWSDQDQF